MKKILIVLLAVTLYCNMAWVVGSYYYHNILTVKAENLTILGKATAGGWNCFAGNMMWKSSAKVDDVAILFFGVLWPVGIFLVAISWVIYGCYWIIYGCYLAGWFIFAGGAARLLCLV